MDNIKEKIIQKLENRKIYYELMSSENNNKTIISLTLQLCKDNIHEEMDAFIKKLGFEKIDEELIEKNNSSYTSEHIYRSV